MKNSHPLLLATVSLSLALCACDSGDKKDANAPLPVGAAKPPKPAKEPAAAANPAPPESTEPVKDMSAGAAAPADAPGGGDMSKYPGVDVINGAITAYVQKQMQAASMNKMADAGKLSAKDQKAKYMAEFNKKSASGNLTSLDQLVSSGILKALPVAPEGKKFVLDVKEQKVRLENK
jgi:hypothetical protein